MPSTTGSWENLARSPRSSGSTTAPCAAAASFPTATDRRPHGGWARGGGAGDLTIRHIFRSFAPASASAPDSARRRVIAVSIARPGLTGVVLTRYVLRRAPRRDKHAQLQHI